MSPFRRTAETWLPSAERVCVFPLRSEAHAECAASVEVDSLTELLLSEFRARGFQAVEPAATEETWESGGGRVGEVFDPDSGQRDDARHEEGAGAPLPNSSRREAVTSR